MADNNNNQKHSIEDVLSEYADRIEGPATQQKTPKSQLEAVQGTASTTKKTSLDNLREDAEEHLSQRGTLREAQEARREEIRMENREKGLGFVELPIEDLPSQGLFYPKGTKVHIRAASGGDIRKWSLMDDTDIQQIDNAISDIVERCVTISCPGHEGGALSWKDIKELDRLYLLIAIHDFTFTEGTNDLKIDVSEAEQVTIKKDHIEFIDLPDSFYKYYSEDERCFVFPSGVPNVKDIKIFMPSVGVTRWLKEYIQKKSRIQEQFDEDFVTVAPMLIRDWRALNDRSYADLVIESQNWPIKTWAIISKVKSELQKAVRPKVKYVEESQGGTVIEKELPLNFHGGIKSVLTLNVDSEFNL